MATDKLLGDFVPQPKEKGGSENPTFNDALLGVLNKHDVVLIQEDFYGPNMLSQQEVNEGNDK